MASCIFPVGAGAVQIGLAAPAASDTFRAGLLVDAGETLARGATSGGAQYNNGLQMTSAGQFVYVDATAGLPADTQYTNGLPMSGGALCISTNAVSTYSNGIPMASNGAVAAGLIP